MEKVVQTITVILQPAGISRNVPRQKTARQLLQFLDLGEEDALVAREGRLLTPDCRIWPGDTILVRQVSSSG